MVQQPPFVPSVAAYRFGTNLDGVQYVIDVHWNGRDEAWYFDLMAEDETPIRMGIKITLGFPLGARSGNALLPEAFFMAEDTTAQGEDANYNDFGTRLVVQYIPIDDLDL